MKIYELLNALINIAEKGANIARTIRSEETLLELLVQEKKGDQKNDRFLQDFKTLADVLVQELVKYDLSQKFPGIGENIYGEESNKFTNTLGESVTIKVQQTVEKTKNLLASVLDENKEAADILAKIVHSEVSVCDTCSTQNLDQNLIVENLGVWIDPIDSTAQYIQGQVGERTDTGLVTEGLQCVAVLIGVYDKLTGLPMIGVANQPFDMLDDKGKWMGKTTWGVCIGDIKQNSLSTTSSPQKTKPAILLSSSESQHIKDSFQDKFVVQEVAGAGYKLLGVSQGHADAYILTKSSNYKWDCCGPHAILRSIGGGIVNYEEVQEIARTVDLDYDLSKLMQIKYHIPDQPELTGPQRWCNDGGIIAYQSPKMLQNVYTTLSNL